MSDDKRKRSPNWLSSEKELLLGIVELHFNIIENKKTDGVTIKSKLAQWQIIADQYNSQTNHCFRTAENLKSQWESMKKVARKDAANNRRHMIQTGGGSPIPPKKEDPFLQRILCLISTSAVGLFNPYDSDSIIPAVQDQIAVPSVETKDFPEPPPAQYKDILLPPTVVIVDDQISETTVQHNKDFVTKDWGEYTPQLLRTPVSQALKIEKNTVTDNIANMIEKQTSNRETWISRRRPIHINMKTLELLHKKKIEAIELQKQFAVEEMERAKHVRAARILALVPNERAPSDASDKSDSENEMHDECASSNFSSPPPAIASSLEGINISETDEELEQQPENTTLPLPESIPLTPILQDIQDSRYDNIPSLSAIPSLPSTPNTPIAPTRSVKRVTRSKQPKVSTTKRRKKAKKLLLDYKWKKTSFRHGASIEAEENDFVDSLDEHASPLDYFYMFFSPNILTDIVDQTNFYSVQEIGRPIQLTVDELKDFISIHLLMGIVQMPSYLDYWSTKFHYGKVADIMPLKRYQQIRRWLHFANNNLDDGDRYHKVRPVLEQIRRNCLKQQGRETRYSIDEMMIAYKGTKAGKRKQYMKDKPNKWGFKNYVRAGVSGIIYDFLLYAGEDTFRYHTFSEEEESLGFGAQVVIALCQSIDRKPAIIYCDNFFSSPELFYVY